MSGISAENIHDAGKESSIITKEILETAIRFKEGHAQFTVEDVRVKSGCEKGENYSSLPFTVEVTVEARGKRIVHNLFIKTLPKGKFANKFINSNFYFLKEKMAFDEIIPDMVQFQKDCDIKPFGPAVPSYYYSTVDMDVSIIVLNDLRHDGYSVHNGREGLSYEHCKLVMQELAVFHALAFAIKNRNPQTMAKYHYLSRDRMTEAFPKHMPKAFASSLRFIKQTVKSDELNKHVEHLLSCDLGSTLRDLVEPMEPFALVCHGDVWCNNIMFKYQQDTPVDMKLLDLQMIRYALPTTDLAFFFYTSTTKYVRDKYMNDLLLLYHDAFIDSIHKLKLEFPEFTFEILKVLFKKSALFGIICACMFLPTMLAKREGLPKYTENMDVSLDLFLDEFYEKIFEHECNIPILKERLSGVIKDAVSLGVI